jgi:hypothetical protein
MPVVNGTWWDTGYRYRRPLTITTDRTLPTGMLIVNDQFDLSTLISQGKVRADFGDVRVVRKLSDTSWQEVPRRVWSSNDTEFFIASSIDRQVDTSYYLYYGNPNAGTAPSFNLTEGFWVAHYLDKWWSSFHSIWEYDLPIDFGDICGPPIDHRGHTGSSFDDSDEYTARLFIPYTGVWTFHEYTNDGWALYIDDVEIGRFDGYQGNQWNTVGSATLKAGWHTFRLPDMWVNCGAIRLTMEGPNFANQIVPANYFQRWFGNMKTGIPAGDEEPYATATATATPTSTPNNTPTVALTNTPTRTPTATPTATAGSGRSAYSQIEAESYTSQVGTRLEGCTDTGGGQDVAEVANGDYLVFNDLDFGTSGPLTVSGRVASGAASGVSGLIEFWVDGLTTPGGTKLGSIAVSNTGDWQSWQTIVGNVSGITGRHTLYVKFTSTQSSDFTNLNWFQFAPRTGGTATATSVSTTTVTPTRTSTAVATATATATASSGRNAYTRIEAESYSSQVGTRLEGCADTGGGQDVAEIANGDYLVFNDIDFGISGPLTVSGRVASGAVSGISGSVEFWVDGLTTPSSTKLGSIAVSSTGDWQSWQTIVGNVNGITGRHTLYVKFTSTQSSDFTNLNWFQFAPRTAGTATATSVPTATFTPTRTPTAAATATASSGRSAYTRIEAESYTSQVGTRLEDCTDTGGGQNVAYIANGDYLVFNDIDFGTSGPLTISGRVASGAVSGISGSIEFWVDGLSTPSGTKLGSIAVSNTGDWQSWQTIVGNVNGITGRHTLYVKFTSTQPSDFTNLNWFQFTSR